MKNKEKYIDELAKAFTDRYFDSCEFRKKYVLKIKPCMSVDCDTCNRLTKEWLEQEYQEPILNEKEKEYLSTVIKPWRDRVIFIYKHEYCDEEYITIRYHDGSCEHYASFPSFKKGTMYKNMELDRKYSLEDLGI